MFAFSIVICCTLLVAFEWVKCSPHAHKSGFSKETLPDGSYHHRDSSHYKDGNHNNEFDHESVLGSHNVAEEFDHLSPEESKKRLKVLALKMDTNDDGQVDKSELTEWVFKSFKMLTDEEALDQLEEEDSDDDGKVTWQEHAAETYSVFDDDVIEDEEHKLSDDFRMMQNDKELFHAADVNNDGILDKKEFSAFSHPEEFGHMHPVIYKHAMEKHDKNNDGFLSFEEFIADNNGGQPDPSSEQYIFEKDHFENGYDQDKDGKLNREEVLLWLIPNNREAADVEADHLIDSSDEDKDGKLSINEIVSHHDVFVGSEATDFGEYLHNTHKFNDEL